MAPITKYFACFSIALSATALTAPHISNALHHHRAVANAVTAPQVSPVFPAASKRQRSLNKRCNPRPSGNSTIPSPSPAYTSTPLPFTNVISSPVPSSSSSSYTSTSSTTYTSAASTSSPTPTSSVPPAQISSDVVSVTIPSQFQGTQNGQGTFYETGLGACGITNNDSQHIVAISHLLFDLFDVNGDPNDNPMCNKQVTASYGGKSVTVTITDRCTGCALTDLDFSPSAFSVLADESLGRIDIQWFFLS